MCRWSQCRRPGRRHAGVVPTAFSQHLIDDTQPTHQLLLLAWLMTLMVMTMTDGGLYIMDSFRLTSSLPLM